MIEIWDGYINPIEICCNFWKQNKKVLVTMKGHYLVSFGRYNANIQWIQYMWRESNYNDRVSCNQWRWLRCVTVLPSLQIFFVILQQERKIFKWEYRCLFLCHLVDKMLIFTKFIVPDMNWLTMIGYPAITNDDWDTITFNMSIFTTTKF